MNASPKTPAYRTLSLRRAQERGMHVIELSAADLFEQLTLMGRDMRLYQSFGSVAGQEMFGTTTFRANADLQRVEAVNSRGQVVVAYPLEPTAGQARPGRFLFRNEEK